MKRINIICEFYPDEEFTQADGFDEALLGTSYDKLNGEYRLVYSRQKCIDKLMEDGMSEINAIEYFDYNVEGAYIGGKTPVWVDDTMFDYE